MKRILVIMSLLFVVMYFSSARTVTNDSTEFYAEDSLNQYTVSNDSLEFYTEDSLDQYLGLNDSIESNFDTNLDSMLNLYYVEESASVDSMLSIPTDSIIPDFPDSVYIARLAEIPTIIDLPYNKIVKNYINAYTNKRRATVEVMLGLSEYYFPVFDDIFDYYDIPNEMKYMSIIESALNPRAYSRTRAVGLWQFMYGTGRMYGLEVNSLVDERMDLYKSTHAAARFAKDLYKRYGDWLLVIAAYNCGPGNVNKAIRRSGGKTNYWDIYYYLPRETRGHVPAFIAATYVMNYYTEHNLTAIKVDMPVLVDTIHISQELHLKQVSEVLGIPIKELRDLNPQYRHDIIPAGKKVYSLSLPLEYTDEFIDLEQVIYSYKDSVFLNKKNLTISPSNSYAQNVPQAPGANYVKLKYIVKSGDNLGYISSWYDVRVSDLKYWNNINRNMIRAGQKLTIYKPKSKANKYKNIDGMSFAEKQKMIGKPVSTAPSKPTAPIKDSGNYVMYTVKYGDNLWDIAKKFQGVSYTDLMKLNNLSENDKINPGQQLKIKPKE